MLVPEIILIRSLKAITDSLAEEYTSAVTKSDTVLYRLFNKDDNGDEIGFGDKDLWTTRATDLFSRTNNNARKMAFFIGYNLERRAIPSVHIILPSESKGRYDTIGNGADEEDTVVENGTGKILINLQKTRIANYQIMITSDNSVEVLLMYYYLSALLLMFNFHFEAKGLRNMQYGGGDLIFDEARVPANIYHRCINLTFDYEMNVKVALSNQVINSINTQLCADFAKHANGQNQPPDKGVYPAP